MKQSSEDYKRPSGDTLADKYVIKCANGEFEVTDNKGGMVIYAVDQTPDELQGQGRWENECADYVELVRRANAFDELLEVAQFAHWMQTHPGQPCIVHGREITKVGGYLEMISKRAIFNATQA